MRFSMHSTDYQDTFIAIAPDCPVAQGTVPPTSAKPSAASLAYQLIQSQPYQLSSDDVLFTVYADRLQIPPQDRQAARVAFFSKPQACLRASDLGKRYGWGIHCNTDGKVALVGAETAAYQALLSGQLPDQPAHRVTVKYAMRTRRA